MLPLVCHPSLSVCSQPTFPPHLVLGHLQNSGLGPHCLPPPSQLQVIVQIVSWLLECVWMWPMKNGGPLPKVFGTSAAHTLNTLTSELPGVCSLSLTFRSLIKCFLELLFNDYWTMHRDYLLVEIIDSWGRGWGGGGVGRHHPQDLTQLLSMYMIGTQKNSYYWINDG